MAYLCAYEDQFIRASLLSWGNVLCQKTGLVEDYFANQQYAQALELLNNMDTSVANLSKKQPVRLGLDYKKML